MPDADPRLMLIFVIAVEQTDPADRAAYLDGACEGDVVLRRRVEALLAAHDAAGRFLEPDSTGSLDPKLPEAVQATAAVAADPPLGTELFTGEARPDGAIATVAVAPTANGPSRFVPGQVIAGRYTLVDVLGEGGMGAVYRAEQSQPVKRQVALKLIKTGMNSHLVLARFDAERQALALMDHPNIARVYDGGATEANQPFFVMELVSGVSITEYCDQHRLPVRARLELFVAVCQAVQHAHQKGIIHRDLKPGNVLVTEVDGRPTPKVIDFGVAKATEFKLTDRSLADTGAIVGTPAYMSPEQADPSSMDIDTRTDVYALGVILYELLAGSPPIDAQQFKRGALLEMLRMVREVDPPRPSTKVSTADALPSIAASRNIDPEHLKRALRGDLDWIVMKALEKDRTRRYETASGFAADVMRHLASEPVVAAPLSRVYRLRKFVRKHRGAVIAASLVVLALLAGVVGTTWGLIQAAKANVDLGAKNDELAGANARVTKANADLSAANAKVEARYNLAVDAIKTFHTGVSEDFLLKEEQFRELRDRLLKSASDFYGKLGALLGKETDLASRRALSQSNFELAELTGKVGRNEDALAAHRAVLAAREALAAAPAADAAAKVDVGRSLIEIGRLLEDTGKTDEALATYRRTQSLLADLAGADAAARAALAAGQSLLGSLLAVTGKTADALAAYNRARANQEALAAVPGASNDARRELALTVHRIARLLWETGKPAQAEAEYRAALAIEQKLADDNPASTRFRSELASSHHNLGLLLQEQGKPEEAEAELRAGLAINQKVTDDNPAVTLFQSDLALSRHALAWLLEKLHKPAEAEVEYRAALAIERKLVVTHPAVTLYRKQMAGCHLNFGQLLLSMSRTSEAEAEYRAAIAIYQKVTDDSPAVTEVRGFLAESHYHLGVVLSRTRRNSEAEAEYREAIAISQKLTDDSPAVTDYREHLVKHHNSLGNLLKTTGKPAAAEAEYRAALANQQKLADDNAANTRYQRNLAQGLHNLGLLLRDTGKPSEALQSFEKALAIRQKLADDNPAVDQYRRDLAFNHNDIGDLQMQAGQSKEMLQSYETAFAIRQKLAADDPANIPFENDLANSYFSLGRTREAIPHLAAVSSATPKDTILALKVAALQAWFGQDKELAATRQRTLAIAKGTNDANVAERAAKVCSVVPSTDKAELEAALALGRTAVKAGKSGTRAYYMLALGMAEYRSGNDAAADLALLAAAKANDPAWLPGISAFYRAMSLFRQGKPDLARKLAAEAAARMKPFPQDEKNPLAAAGPDVPGNRHADYLILWLTYKEAKAMIQFDAAAPLKEENEKK